MTAAANGYGWVELRRTFSGHDDVYVLCLYQCPVYDGPTKCNFANHREKEQ